MRRKLTQRPFWVLSLALAMLALLPSLAALQYHWLGQVSEGERERKKSVLTTMARQFCHDLDSRLTDIYLRFTPMPIPLDGKPDQSQDDFAAKYQRWRETAAHPKLIKEVYQTQTGENGERLSRYNFETGAFEPCEWLDSMSNLRKKLEEARARDESLPAQVREAIKLNMKIPGEGGAKETVFHLSPSYFDQDLPGLVIPVGVGPEEGFMPILSPRPYRIIAFDVDYISRELIPELAGRHFRDSDREYTIAVTKRGQTDQVIYRSDASVTEASLASGDVTIGFFKILLDETDRFIFDQWRRHDANASVQLKAPLNRHRFIALGAILGAGDLKSDNDENAASPQRPSIKPTTEGITRSLLNQDGAGAW